MIFVVVPHFHKLGRIVECANSQKENTTTTTAEKCASIYGFEAISFFAVTRLSIFFNDHSNWNIFGFSSTKNTNGRDINQTIGFRNGHFQSARCRFLTTRKKRWKWILSEWTFERKTTIAALQYGSHLCLCCSWRLLKPNFAINAQLAHMCSIDTLCIQAIVLCSAINFHSIDKTIVCVWFCNYNFECTHAQWMLIERPRDWKSQSIHSTKSNWIDERMNERSLLHRETWNTHRERERLTGVFALEKKSISLFLMRQFLAY